jgi:hypothetical protein
LGERENGVQERKKGGDTSKGEQKIKDNILTATKKKDKNVFQQEYFKQKKRAHKERTCKITTNTYAILQQ